MPPDIAATQMFAEILVNVQVPRNVFAAALDTKKIPLVDVPVTFPALPVATQRLL